MSQPQPREARGSEQRGRPFRSLVELGEPGIYIAANVAHPKIGASPKQLGTASQAAGGN
jgi:hypothetical protein